MSKRVDRVVYIYNKLNRMTKNDKSIITLDFIADTVKQACTEIADKDKVTPTAVMNSVTKELELSTLLLYMSLKEHLLLNNRRDSNLVRTVCYHSCDTDNNANIIALLSK